MTRKIVRVVLWILLALVALAAIQLALHWNQIQRTMLGGVHVYETVPPQLPADIPHPAILVFSKTNGFRHEEAIPAANGLFARMAKQNGWGYFQTENGAAFSPAILARFDAVVFNSVSGDVFTPAQRDALKHFIENGGGFVGVHGSGGDFSYDWRWYVEDLIGAQFKGHPMDPQFQAATVHVEDKAHPATRGLPDSWRRVDEWYSFEKSPRRPGYHVLLTLDERTFANHKMFGRDLAMGADHPIAWWHCVGKGRVFYSAMGHQATAYAEPAYRQVLQGAINWALGREGPDCGALAPQPSASGQ
jgi:type 1 glutamine amidotransferase